MAEERGRWVIIGFSFGFRRTVLTPPPSGTPLLQMGDLLELSLTLFAQLPFSKEAPEG